MGFKKEQKSKLKSNTMSQNLSFNNSDKYKNENEEKVIKKHKIKRKEDTHFVPERRVAAMKSLGDLRLSIGGRAKEEYL